MIINVPKNIWLTRWRIFSSSKLKFRSYSFGFSLYADRLSIRITVLKTFTKLFFEHWKDLIRWTFNFWISHAFLPYQGNNLSHRDITCNDPRRWYPGGPPPAEADETVPARELPVLPVGRAQIVVAVVDGADDGVSVNDVDTGLTATSSDRSKNQHSYS